MEKEPIKCLYRQRMLQVSQTWRCPIPVCKNFLGIAFIYTGEKKKKNQLVSLQRQDPHWIEFDKNWNVPASCPLCGSDMETTDHLLVNCAFASSIWKHLLNNPSQNALPCSLKYLRLVWRENIPNVTRREAWDCMVATTWCCAWNGAAGFSVLKPLPSIR